MTYTYSMCRRLQASCRCICLIVIAASFLRIENGHAAYSVGRVVRLTRERETDAKPTFSPDGTKIAFVSGRQGNKDLWIVNADGTDPYRLTSALSPFQFYDDPAWSPDGQKILCTSNHGSRGNPDLWILDLQRGAQKQLTSNDNIDWMPCWSPDGRKVAFISDRNGQDSLWVMEADGQNPKLLVTGAWEPAWSPDGSLIAYQSLLPGKEGVWTIPVAGGEPSLLMNGLSEPAWSPKGSKIAAVMRRDNQRVLFLVSTTGGKSREISAAGNNVASPAWSARGDAIVFDAELQNNRDLYLVQLERQPPAATITLPPAAARVQGVVEIIGTVTAAPGSFKSAAVEYGAGPNPTEWTTIRDKITDPIQDGPLARWDTQELTGDYTLRVSVSDLDDDTSFAMIHVALLSDFGVEYLKHNTPTTMIGGQTYSADLTLKNTGRMTWAASGNNAVTVCYRWVNEAGQVAANPNQSDPPLRTPLPGAVNLGETVVVSAKAKAPTEPGRYKLVWDLTQGELLTFSQRNASPLEVPVTIEVPFNVMFLNERTPTQITPSQLYTVDVGVKNIGATAWNPTGDQLVGISYRWLNLDGTPLDEQPLTTPVPAAVPPGAETTMPARLRAPDVPGKYTLRWDFRLSGGTGAWFSEMGARTLDVSVSVINLYAVEYQDHVVATSMTPGEIYVANLKVRNAGSMKWRYQGTSSIRVGYRWIDEQGNPVTAEAGQAQTAISPLPYDVEPGQSAGVVLQVAAPAVPGTYTLQWDLVQGDRLWFSSQGSKPLSMGVIVARPSYSVAITPKGPPSTMVVGQLYTISLNLKNTGTLTWATGGRNPVKVGYHWINAAGNNVESLPILTDLPRPVSLGEEVTVSSQVRAPDAPDSYTLKWDLFQEGQGWFSGRGATTLNVPVTVDSLYLAKFVSHDTPKTQVAGQSYTVHLRLENLGALPWESTGGLPVQLSYRWVSGNGRTVIAKGVMTNFPTAVAKSQSVDVVARLQAPETAGTYTLKWDLVQGDLLWFEEKGSTPLEVQVEVK